MQLITRTELAHQAGVTKSAVTQAVTKKLRPACVGKGRALKLNLDHPLVQAYIGSGEKGTKPTGKQKPVNGTSSSPPPPPSYNVPGLDVEVEGLEELTVKQVAMKYGGVGKFADYVKALKNIAEYKIKDQQHRQKRGELIERETTAAACFMLIDIAFKRIVGEMPGAVIPQLVPLILSKGEGCEKDAEQKLVDQVSKILKDCKAEVRKRLAETGGDHGD